jgi:hypothetical protein
LARTRGVNEVIKQTKEIDRGRFRSLNLHLDPITISVLGRAVVLFYMLAQSAKTTFLLANGEFQFFVEAMDGNQVPGTEKRKISLLRQRAMEARRQKVDRGLVLTQVPVGYVRTENEGIEKTPDRQVQEAIAGIFRKFRELGSVRQVLLWYRDEKLLIPALSRESGHRRMVWIEPVYPVSSAF